MRAVSRSHSASPPTGSPSAENDNGRLRSSEPRRRPLRHDVPALHWDTHVSDVFLTAGHCFEETMPLGFTTFGVTFDEVVAATPIRVPTQADDLSRCGACRPDWGFPSEGDDNSDRPTSRCSCWTIPSRCLSTVNFQRRVFLTASTRRPPASQRWATERSGMTRRRGRHRWETSRGASSQRRTCSRCERRGCLLDESIDWKRRDVFWDSGGPDFLVLGRVNADRRGAHRTGDRYCRATDQDYRLDTPPARAFLATF